MLLLLRIGALDDGVAPLDPLLVAAHQRDDIGDTGLLENQRHTGARLFGQSTAIRDDQATLAPQLGGAGLG